MSRKPTSANEAFDQAKHAVVDGELHTLEQLLGDWPEIGRMSDMMSDNATLLMIAAGRNQPLAFDSLLPHSDPTARDGSGRTLLIAAAMANSTECATRALVGCHGREADNDGLDALMHAVSADADVQLISFLEPLSDPEQTSSRHDMDALMLAARGGPNCVEHLRVLLETRDPLRRNANGHTALLVAAILNENAEAILLIWSRLDGQARLDQGPGAFAKAAGSLGVEKPWAAIDELSDYARHDDLKKAFAVGGREKMPRAAARLEAKALAETLAEHQFSESSTPLSPETPARRL